MTALAAQAMTARQRALSLTAVIVSTVGLGLSYGVGYPLTALKFEEWGAPGWLIGLAGGMPALAVFLLLPVLPRIIGRIGAVQSMVIGCTLTTLGFLLMPVFQSVEAWILLRFLIGAGMTFPWLVGETWINTVTTESARGRMMALYVMGLFTGYAAGPLVLNAVGTDGFAPYAVGVGAMVATVVPLLAAWNLAPALEPHPQSGLLGAIRLAPIAMIGAFAGGITELGYFSLLPVYALGAGLTGADGLVLLSTLMVGGIVLQFAVGWLCDRVSRDAVMIGMGFVCAVLAIAAAAAIDSQVPRLVLTFLLGGAVLGFYSVGLIVLGTRVPVSELAVANAAFLMIYQAGSVVGPGVAGAAMDLWRPHGFVVAMVVFALAASCATIWLISRRARGRRVRSANPSLCS
ncbi:MFS transporter [Pelagibius litoralis]|uniref:MFS transporter n=1 Tax=Pelagibius litoralis TaxID=374515 RepID=A0A967KBQ7_9PROT|nr:MFS transporter [Pelagibius litoralis]NIA71232.1 MFS transporter [Pelagibius litoralis]